MEKMYRYPTYLSDALVYLVLTICVGIVISCSIAGYVVSWNKAMKHVNKDVKVYGEVSATKLLHEWQGKFIKDFNEEQERMGKR